MSFCTYSQEMRDKNFTAVDNIFIREYLPEAPAKYVDIYLFGLYLCSAGESDNTIETMARVLSVDREDLLTAFTYWEEAGLVHILSKEQPEIVYLSVRTEETVLKKIKPQKYLRFNKEMEGIICGRMIGPNEFSEYYIFLETTFFEPDALVEVARYCTELKGTDINYPYILKVARNLNAAGIKTKEAVAERLATGFKYTDDVKLIFKDLGIRRNIDFEDRRLFEKWTAEMGFSLETLGFVAKKSKRFTMEKLDKKLETYYKSGLTSKKEIENYETEKSDMFELTKEIVRILGLYFQSVDFLIEEYVTPWIRKGFDGDALKLVARFCSIHENKHSFEKLDELVEKFYKMGFVTVTSISKFTASVVEQDSEIKEVLSAAGLEKHVSQNDRKIYKTWTKEWNFERDMILFAANLAANAKNPVAYMNKILSDFKTKGIYKVEKARLAAEKKPDEKQRDFMQHDYTKEQLNALFDNLDELGY